MARGDDEAPSASVDMFSMLSPLLLLSGGGAGGNRSVSMTLEILLLTLLPVLLKALGPLLKGVWKFTSRDARYALSTTLAALSWVMLLKPVSCFLPESMKNVVGIEKLCWALYLLPISSLSL